MTVLAGCFFLLLSYIHFFFLSGSKGVNRYGLRTKINYNDVSEKQFKKDYSFWFLSTFIFILSVSNLLRIKSDELIDKTNKTAKVTTQESSKGHPNISQSLPLPLTGSGNNSYIQGVSPLKIKTQKGSHYWVKIVDAYNKNEVASFFIRGGETLDVRLPTGSYYIKYAYGNIWYGEQDLFGKNTRYAKADKLFYFSYKEGYIIELIKQHNGNLNTPSIDRSQF